uniref:Alpha-1,6-mannosylglycoprotein 6-beta-N-acetylglucosaminyltransferase A n=1 Tax=Schistocephalus solidus TaxID=70667 RepID=A0A0X3PVT7_SCHSO
MKERRFRLRTHSLLVVTILVLTVWTLLNLYEYTRTSHVDVLQNNIIEESRTYVRLMAQKEESLPDGLYAMRNTNYELKKTLAVMLSNMLDRLSILEDMVKKLEKSAPVEKSVASAKP